MGQLFDTLKVERRQWASQLGLREPARELGRSEISIFTKSLTRKTCPPLEREKAHLITHDAIL